MHFSTKIKTYHDVIPISCLTEFPNVVQMAKVSKNIKTKQHTCDNMFTKRIKHTFFHLQLVCEEVNVDRFYPVLYPKVSLSLSKCYLVTFKIVSSKSRYNCLKAVLRQNCDVLIRHQGLLLRLMSMCSTITSSLESFIKSLDR